MADGLGDNKNSNDRPLGSPLENPIVSSTGEPLGSNENVKTERQIQRKREDEAYVPVIIKRNDQSRIHPDDVLEIAIFEGVEQIKRSSLSLLLSSIAAGLILGFAAMAVGVIASAIVAGGTEAADNILASRVMIAFVYPLGFIICIMSGTQLFTEHTATAVYPILDKKASLVDLMRLWVLVICGNIAGTFLSSLFLVGSESVVNAGPGYRYMANHLIHFSAMELLLSAILAGWLMAQGAWLVVSTASHVAKIISIYLVTFLIGIGGLHHSIAGSAELFIAMHLSSDISIAKVLPVIGIALLGNLIGGSVFVALLNYGHIRQTQT